MNTQPHHLFDKNVDFLAYNCSVLSNPAVRIPRRAVDSIENQLNRIYVATEM